MFKDHGILLTGSELVSCVTVTQGRTELIGTAIQCFVSQTHPLREMIIVSQGNKEQNEVIKKMIEKYSDIHFVEVPSDLTLGEMRNLSIELAHGDIICQWDDDDIYHPQRISTQFKSLRGDSIASLYTRYLKYFADTGKMYMIDHTAGTSDYLDVLKSDPSKKYLCGSVMFKKQVFHECNNILYPENGNQSTREEDLNVLKKLMKFGKVASVDAGYEYCYVFHGGNVYQRKHHEMLLHKKCLSNKTKLLSYKQEIKKLLKMSNIGNVDVCVAPIINFDLENIDVERMSEVIYKI